MAVRELRVVISGDSLALERAMARSSSASTKAATSLEAAGMRMQRTGKTMSAAGRTLTRSVTLPIAAVAAVSAKLAVDFEKSMRNVNSIAGLPEKQFQRLNRQVLDLAGPTAQAPKTLAEGLYDLVSSGFKAKEAITVLKASAKAASAGLTTTEISTKAVAAALNAYQRPAKDAKAVSDDLFQTVNLGVVTFEELAGSIGYVLPAAATMGINLKEVGSSIATLTKQGQGGETAITNINQAITSFIKPSKEMKAMLKELGYESGEALINQKGFQGALETVTAAAHGNKEAIGKMFSNVRAMRAVFGLTGKGAKSAAADLRGFMHDAGATNKVFKEQEKTLAFQWSRLRSELEVTGITLGKSLIPILRSLIPPVKSVAEWFTGLPKSVQSTAVKVGLVVAALGPVLSITGKLLSGWGKLFILFGKAGRALGIFEAASAAGAVGAAAAGRAGAVATGAAAGSAGAFGEKSALAASGLFGAAGGGIAAKLKPLGQAIGRGLVAVAAGYFVAEIAGRITGATEGESVFKQLTHGFNTQGVAETEARALKRMKNQTAALEHVRVRIELDQLAGLGRLQADLADGLSLMTQIYVKGTRGWREATANTMKEVVASIKAGMRNGSITAEAGQKAITRILARLKIVQGSDPLGLAKGIVASFRKADGVTQAGMNRLLKNLRVMPKGAREQAQTAVLEMANAWAKGHPKIERQVDVLRKNLEHKFGKTNQSISRRVGNLVNTVSGAFSNLAQSVSGSINIMGINVSGILSQLGITKAVNFTVKVAKSAVKGIGNLLPGHAEGGFIVPGPGVGDIIHAALPPESFVLNKKATASFGFQDGGKVRVMLEPGERVFLPQEVKSIGLGNLEAMNAAVPRFAIGGRLAHPHLAGGPGPMRHMGQAMIDKVYRAALRVLKAKEAQIRAAGPGGRTAYGPKGIGTYMGVPMANWVIQALQYAAGKGTAPQPTSGYRSHAQNVAEGRNYYSEHEGTQYPHGAVDFGGYTTGLAAKMSVVNATADFKYPLLAPIGFRDDGHASGTGHRLGGLIRRFAKGGKLPSWVHGSSTLSADQLASLAHYVGMPNPGLMAQIALAESGGNPRSMGAAGDKGLWQIIPSTASAFGINYGQLFDPLANAKGAAKVLAGQGISAWSTYNSGAYASQPKGTVSSLGGAGGKGGALKEKPKFGLRAAKVVALPPLGPTPLLPSAKGLASSFQRALRAPGLSFAGKTAVGEQALERAEGSYGKAQRGADRLRAEAEKRREAGDAQGAKELEDQALAAEEGPRGEEESVLRFQEELLKRNKRRLQKALAKVNRELKTRQSAKQRKQSLGKRAHIEEELRGAESGLSAARSTGEGLVEEGEERLREAIERQTEASEAVQKAEEERKQAEEEHTAALKELSKQMEEQTNFAKSATATSSAVAWRALSDILSGQLGPRAMHRAATAGSGSVGGL